ncbi:MAG TPA: ATPase domain-containing protein [Candidatus Aquilonibacter sp.]|nr:ATPase domain-containing protein [Candidatus Aquilonibacter sp.]
MERVATGIDGFDNLVEGGLPSGTNILVTGAPGTGKSIFALKYLYEGALKGEHGLYISVDSSLPMIRQQAKLFNWDIETLEKEGKLFFLQVPLDKMKFNLFEMIESVRKQIGAKRVVFDSLATFAINLDLFTIPLGYAGSIASSVSVDGSHDNSTITDKGDKIFYTGNSEKRMIFLILAELRNLGTTNLVITYGDLSGEQLTVDGVSEFECDGIIQMRNELIGAKRVRSMEILKMRDTNHSPYIHDVQISTAGIVIKPAEEMKI